MYDESNSSAIEELATIITQHSNNHLIFASQKQKILFEDGGKSYIYYLKQGKIQLHRKVDNIVVLNLSSPYILGLTSLNTSEYFHYIVTVSDCQIVAVEKHAAIMLLNEKNLWRYAFDIVAQAAQLYYQRDELISSPTVYGVIKSQLEKLYEIPLHERKNISVFEYIMNRSRVSRSSLNKVLRDLSKGGYIQIERGKLLDMGRLPSKY